MWGYNIRTTALAVDVLSTSWHWAPRVDGPAPYTAPWTTGSVYTEPESIVISDYTWTL